MLVGWSRVATQSQISLGTDLKTPFSRCFGLKTLKIRGVSFKNIAPPPACVIEGDTLTDPPTPLRDRR